jgi:predicted dehydrogenase
MIEAARAAGVVLFYGETNHTLPSVVEAKRAVADGRIGTLVGIQATYAHWQGGAYLGTAWRYDPAVTGGGQLLDGGIHYVDVLLQLGGPVEAVSAFTTRFRPELGGEDTAVLNVRFADGPLGTLFSSQAAGIWTPGASVVVYGTEGVLTLGGPHGALALHRPDLPDRKEVLRERDGDGFAAMTGRYLDAVLSGAENPSPGGVGRENLRVVLAAYESAERGAEVRLTDFHPA